MNGLQMSTAFFIAILIALVGITYLANKRIGRRITPLAGLSFVSVLGGLVLGEKQVIGYVLLIIGIILAIIDMILKARNH